MLDMNDALAMLDQRGIAYSNEDQISAGTDVATGNVRVLINGIAVIDTATNGLVETPIE